MYQFDNHIWQTWHPILKTDLQSMNLRLNQTSNLSIFRTSHPCWLKKLNESTKSTEQIILHPEKSSRWNWDTETNVKFEHLQFHDYWAIASSLWSSQKVQSKWTSRGALFGQLLFSRSKMTEEQVYVWSVQTVFQ